MWGRRKWRSLVVVSLLLLTPHSLDHAHLLLMTCWGDTYTISLPMTEDARGLSVKLDPEFISDLTVVVVPVGGPWPPPDPNGCWP